MEGAAAAADNPFDRLIGWLAGSLACRLPDGRSDGVCGLRVRVSGARALRETVVFLQLFVVEVHRKAHRAHHEEAHGNAEVPGPEPALDGAAVAPLLLWLQVLEVARG